MAKIKKSLHDLKSQASELGLTPYASLYGDRRQLATWEKLLEGSEELVPLPKRAIEVSDRAQIKWKLAIALFVGMVSLLCLFRPLVGKLPVRITIELGRK
ncbi:MAG: hypothetical protein JGK29_03935 [Microcoleus sp. PH2017_17_BER_D_A]|nr:hypothetical protein [Microcoleus sp. PH2017_17_BER_D_A]